MIQLSTQTIGFSVKNVVVVIIKQRGKKCKSYRIVTNNSATNVTFETETNVNIESTTNVTFEKGTNVNIESTTNVNHALIDLTPFQQPTIRINEPVPNSEVNTKNE